MVSSARAVSWSSIPASSISSTSPRGAPRRRAGRQTSPMSDSGSMSPDAAGSSCRSRASESRAGGPAMPPSGVAADSGPRLGPPSASASPPPADVRAASSRGARGGQSVVLPAPAAPSITTSGAAPASARTTAAGRGSRPASASVADRCDRSGWCRSASRDAQREATDQVGFDLEDVPRGQRPDMLGHAWRSSSGTHRSAVRAVRSSASSAAPRGRRR